MAKCKKLQQKFYENLGDREYDCFQESESKYLKLKIGYTLYGIPKDNKKYNFMNGEYNTVEETYNKKQIKTINDIYSRIKSRSIYNKYKGQVVVAFLFNFCELLNSNTSKKKNQNTEPKIDFFPIFRVRKCFGSPTNKNCCFYIDEYARVYKNWNDYMKNNKIPKAKMFLPKDGRYQGNGNDEVQLDEQLSPACSLKKRIIKAVDVSTMAVSVISGSVLLIGTIKSLVVPSLVIILALIARVGVGIYTMIRNSLVLHDRNVHSQSISLENNEARNCYLNMMTGATNVVTSTIGVAEAATMALNNETTIGVGAPMSVNVLNFSVDGCNMANSIFSIADDLINKRNPSDLDIMHLTTTALFFGNAVINIQAVSAICEETQNRNNADIVANRSQDLRIRAKTKFLKTDMTSTDNNLSVKFINDSGDYCSNFLNFTIRDNRGDLSKNIAIDILKTFISKIDLDCSTKFDSKVIENKEHVYSLFKIILSRFELSIQEMLLEIFEHFYVNVIQSYITLKKIYPKDEIIVVLLNFIINFIKYKVTEMEIEYQEKKSNALKELNISEKDYDENLGFKNNAERMMQFFGTVILKMISARCLLNKEMIDYFSIWFNQTALEHREKNSERLDYRKSVDCSVCGGFHYVDI